MCHNEARLESRFYPYPQNAEQARIFYDAFFGRSIEQARRQKIQQTILSLDPVILTDAIVRACLNEVSQEELDKISPEHQRVISSISSQFIKTWEEQKAREEQMQQSLRQLEEVLNEDRRLRREIFNKERQLLQETLNEDRRLLQETLNENKLNLLAKCNELLRPLNEALQRQDEDLQRLAEESRAFSNGFKAFIRRDERLATSSRPLQEQIQQFADGYQHSPIITEMKARLQALGVTKLLGRLEAKAREEQMQQALRQLEEVFNEDKRLLKEINNEHIRLLKEIYNEDRRLLKEIYNEDRLNFLANCNELLRRHDEVIKRRNEVTKRLEESRALREKSESLITSNERLETSREPQQEQIQQWTDELQQSLTSLEVVVQREAIRVTEMSAQLEEMNAQVDALSASMRLQREQIQQWTDEQQQNLALLTDLEDPESEDIESGSTHRSMPSIVDASIEESGVSSTNHLNISPTNDIEDTQIRNEQRILEEEEHRQQHEDFIQNSLEGIVSENSANNERLQSIVEQLQDLRETRTHQNPNFTLMSIKLDYLEALSEIVRNSNQSNDNSIECYSRQQNHEKTYALQYEKFRDSDSKAAYLNTLEMLSSQLQGCTAEVQRLEELRACLDEEIRAMRSEVNASIEESGVSSTNHLDMISTNDIEDTQIRNEQRILKDEEHRQQHEVFIRNSLKRIVRENGANNERLQSIVEQLQVLRETRTNQNPNFTLMSIKLDYLEALSETVRKSNQSNDTDIEFYSRQQNHQKTYTLKYEKFRDSDSQAAYLNTLEMLSNQLQGCTDEVRRLEELRARLDEEIRDMRNIVNASIEESEASSTNHFDMNLPGEIDAVQASDISLNNLEPKTLQQVKAPAPPPSELVSSRKWAHLQDPKLTEQIPTSPAIAKPTIPEGTQTKDGLVIFQIADDNPIVYFIQKFHSFLSRILNLIFYWVPIVVYRRDVVPIQLGSP